MPNGLIPPGYQAVPIGSALTIEGLGDFAPVEEGAAEGSLMLLQLDFAGFPEIDALMELEAKLREAGVYNWPGHPFIVYADASRPSVYLAWQKGVPWLPIIIGIVGAVILPPLLGGVIWWLIPETVKQTITMIIGMGMMMLMMWLMMGLVKPLTAPEEPRRLERE